MPSHTRIVRLQLDLSFAAASRMMKLMRLVWSRPSGAGPPSW